MSDAEPEQQPPQPMNAMQTDEELLSQFCEVNGLDTDLLTGQMQQEVIKLCRLTLKNIKGRQFLAQTYNIEINPNGGWDAAYFRAFIDHILPLDRPERVQFEQQWQQKIGELVADVKKKCEADPNLAEKAAGLHLPPEAQKKLIIPGRG